VPLFHSSFEEIENGKKGNSYKERIFDERKRTEQKKL